MNILTNGKGEALQLNYAQLKTLTGLTVDEALKQLQRQLEAAAYKKVTGGGKELTDIKPAWLTEELTKVFGLCGLGWYYGFDEPQVSVSRETAKSGREYDLWQADILNGWLIYRLTDGERIVESEPIRATGGSDNEVKEYAIRGAVTNMIGAAASKLCWQLFIYKGEKEAPKEPDPAKPVDTRAWYYKALDYAHAHPEVWKEPLGKTEAGQTAVARLNTMVGGDGWWNADRHAVNALKAYTGHLTFPELEWKDLEKLVRIYAGPQAIAGHPVSDVMYYSFCKPSEWQQIMAAIPIMEDMILTEDMANALNDILPAFGTMVKRGKGLDVEIIAGNLRRHFVKIAEEVPVPPTSELVKEVAGAEEIPY